MNAETLAYIAGLFDGEGCVRFAKPTRCHSKGRLMAKITQKDPMILYWVQEQFGYGGVFAKGGGAHDYQVSSLKARQFLYAIRPYLRVKGAAVDEKLGLDAETINGVCDLI